MKKLVIFGLCMILLSSLVIGAITKPSNLPNGNFESIVTGRDGSIIQIWQYEGNYYRRVGTEDATEITNTLTVKDPTSPNNIRIWTPPKPTPATAISSSTASGGSTPSAAAQAVYRLQTMSGTGLIESFTNLQKKDPQATKTTSDDFMTTQISYTQTNGIRVTNTYTYEKGKYVLKKQQSSTSKSGVTSVTLYGEKSKEQYLETSVEGKPVSRVYTDGERTDFYSSDRAYIKKYTKPGTTGVYYQEVVTKIDGKDVKVTYVINQKTGDIDKTVIDKQVTTGMTAQMEKELKAKLEVKRVELLNAERKAAGLTPTAKPATPTPGAVTVNSAQLSEVDKLLGEELRNADFFIGDYYRDDKNNREGFQITNVMGDSFYVSGEAGTGISGPKFVLRDKAGKILFTASSRSELLAAMNKAPALAAAKVTKKGLTGEAIYDSAIIKDAASKYLNDLNKRIREAEGDAQEALKKERREFRDSEEKQYKAAQNFLKDKTTSEKEYIKTYTKYSNTFRITDIYDKEDGTISRLAAVQTNQGLVALNNEQYQGLIKEFEEFAGHQFFDAEGVERNAVARAIKNKDGTVSMQLEYWDGTQWIKGRTDDIKRRVKAAKTGKVPITAQRLYAWTQKGAQFTSLLGFKEEEAWEWADELFGPGEVADFLKGNWEDSVCTGFKFVDKPSEQGVLMTDGGQGTLAAHIEAERSELTFYNDTTKTEQTEYLYKITYAFDTGEAGKEDGNLIEFNIKLNPNGKKLYDDDYKIGGKDNGVDVPNYAGRLGSSAILLYFPEKYTEICLTYKLQGNWPLSGEEICNTVIDTVGKDILDEVPDTEPADTPGETTPEGYTPPTIEP
ncbi:MAG: hypothetical protein U9R08_03050 [Nanoarchaeota archaeon]|nr:hypothetical protein [Nanoarchaeota archaeon]